MKKLSQENILKIISDVEKEYKKELLDLEESYKKKINNLTKEFDQEKIDLIKKELSALM